MASEGRPLALPNHYPGTTRRHKFAESFGNGRMALRFGTEGSLVQIQSPRPSAHFPSENPQSLVCRIIRFSPRTLGAEPSDRCFKSDYTSKSFGISNLCCWRSRLGTQFPTQSTTSTLPEGDHPALTASVAIHQLMGLADDDIIRETKTGGFSRASRGGRSSSSSGRAEGRCDARERLSRPALPR